MLTRAELLAQCSAALPWETVHVPEWGGTIGVRVLSAAERDGFELAIAKARGAGRDVYNPRARLVVLCACDATGARLFTDADAEAIGAASGIAVERVFAVAMRINGMAGDDGGEKKSN